MTDIPNKSPARAAQALLLFGIAVMATAAVWWLIYYGQYRGMFELLDVKLACFSGDSEECTTLQHFISPSLIPAYSPMLLWAGTVVTLLGLYLVRRNKA